VFYKLTSTKLTLEKAGRIHTIEVKGAIATNNAAARAAFVEGGKV